MPNLLIHVKIKKIDVHEIVAWDKMIIGAVV